MDLSDFINTINKIPDQLIELTKKLEEFEEKLNKLDLAIHDRNNEEFLDSFLTLEKILEKLEFSRRKFFNLKEQHRFELIQIGRQIYMTKEQLNKLMEKHTIRTNNNE